MPVFSARFFPFLSFRPEAVSRGSTYRGDMRIMEQGERSHNNILYLVMRRGMGQGSPF